MMLRGNIAVASNVAANATQRAATAPSARDRRSRNLHRTKRLKPLGRVPRIGIAPAFCGRRHISSIDHREEPPVRRAHREELA